MKLIVRCMREHLGHIGLSMTAKLLAAVGELMIPYVLEYMIDWIVPRNELRPVVLCGLGMAAIALAGNIL